MPKGENGYLKSFIS